MTFFYMGIDVSKGYADFVIINQEKKPVMENFQLDDTSWFKKISLVDTAERLARRLG